MEFTGRILKVGDIQKGTNQQTGLEWRAQQYIVEFFESVDAMWSDRIAIQLRNDDIEAYHLREGDDVRVRFWLSAREYNGRMYQDVRLAANGLQVVKRFDQEAVGENKQPVQENKQPVQENKQAPEPAQPVDDLPF